MAAIKNYQNKFVEASFHPKENIIVLKLKNGAPVHQFFKIENKIKTALSVDSSNQDSKNSKILKLSNAPSNSESIVHEFLQSVLAGGSSVEDAETAVEEQESQSPPPPSSVQVTPEGRAFKAFKILLESTYRTGKYWDEISAATGKSKQQISADDILSARRIFTKKKRSPQRDKILRALDKASKYFSRKLRLTVGDEASRIYRRRYKSIGNLTPHDYADKEKDKTLDQIIQDIQPQQPEAPEIENDPEVVLAKKKIEKYFK